MKNFILALDQGTTGSTALLVDAQTLKVAGKANFEFPQIYPNPGWVEHNLNDIWESIEKSINKVVDDVGIETKQIISIGITNQRETTCAFKKDGTPLANAIVWQDRRTAEFCDSVRDKYKSLARKTGLPLDPYFSGTKMRWLLQNNSEVQAAAKNNDLYFGNIDTFLTYKMTAQNAFVTEPSNASRTLLMDLDATNWDDDLLSFLEINKEFLPEIKDSFTKLGETKGLSCLPDGIPISCILGDQQAALFGQAGYNKGDLKCTYGTGAFILLNTGTDKVYSKNGLLTTVAYRHEGKTAYALEGSCYIAGAAVQWLRDNLGIIESSPDVEKLALEVNDLKEMEYLMLLPFFTGIGSPYWKADAKAALVGITRDTNKQHIARACLDGMALSINDSIKALTNDSPTEVKSIKVDGGASQNNLLMQIQANFSDKKIIRPKVIETTAYGVAIGSLIGLGQLSFDDVQKLWEEDTHFTPVADSYNELKLNQWNELIHKIYL